MMHEAELYVMKGRLLEGRRHKAQRGDLLNEPPLGYVRGPDGDYQLPDFCAMKEDSHWGKKCAKVHSYKGYIPLKGSSRGSIPLLKGVHHAQAYDDDDQPC